MFVKEKYFALLLISISLLGPIAAFAKKGTVVLLILPLLAINRNILNSNSIKYFFLNRIFLCIHILFLWSCISLLWSSNGTFFDLLRIFSIIYLSIFFIKSLEKLNANQISIVLKVLSLTFIFLLIVLFFEVISDSSIHKLIRPYDNVARDGEWVPYIKIISARGTSILCCFSILVAILISIIFKYKFFGIVYLVLSLFISSNLPMQASLLSIITGIIIFTISIKFPKLILRSTFFGLIFGTLIFPFVMNSLYIKKDYDNINVEFSRGLNQRLVIWDYTSELISKKIFFGYGFDSSRYLSRKAEMYENTNWSKLPLHPHNLWLQIWLELGLIGAIIFCIFLFNIYKSVLNYNFSTLDLSIISASLASVSILSLISFGIWQFWWISLIGILFGCIKIKTKVTEKMIQL
ncbi:MAG: hypothetical protein CBC47_05090 [Alphaproteobacteria bacterium TMED87]|nr:hypothetical protein [Rhodospirillaceae bacterium]OUV09460.1 MAG: hypothetical protein CBC47_05090 [Alphaproteobacteria bacterium TMED87]